MSDESYQHNDSLIEGVGLVMHPAVPGLARRCALPHVTLCNMPTKVGVLGMTVYV